MLLLIMPRLKIKNKIENWDFLIYKTVILTWIEAINQLEETNKPDPKVVQINLTGFLNAKVRHVIERPTP